MNTFDVVETAFIPNRSIGEFIANVTVEEKSTDQLEITEHPVEQGASINDHAYSINPTISVTALFKQNGQTLSQIYIALLKLQDSRELFTLITGKRSYSNCLMKSLVERNDRITENILSVQFEFRQLTIVTLEVTKIAEVSKQAIPQSTQQTVKTGVKQPQVVRGALGKSLLDAASQFIGVI